MLTRMGSVIVEKMPPMCSEAIYKAVLLLYKFLIGIQGGKIWVRNSYFLGEHICGISDIDVSMYASSQHQRLSAIKFHDSFRRVLPIIGELNIYFDDIIDWLNANANPYELCRDEIYIGRHYPKRVLTDDENDKLIFLGKMLKSDWHNLKTRPAKRLKKWRKHFAQVKLPLENLLESNFSLSGLLDCLDKNTNHFFKWTDLEKVYDKVLSNARNDYSGELDENEWHILLFANISLWLKLSLPIAAEHRRRVLTLKRQAGRERLFIKQSIAQELAHLVAGGYLEHDSRDVAHFKSLLSVLRSFASDAEFSQFVKELPAPYQKSFFPNKPLEEQRVIDNSFYSSWAEKRFAKTQYLDRLRGFIPIFGKTNKNFDEIIGWINKNANRYELRNDSSYIKKYYQNFKLDECKFDKIIFVAKRLESDWRQLRKLPKDGWKRWSEYLEQADLRKDVFSKDSFSVTALLETLDSKASNYATWKDLGEIYDRLLLQRGGCPQTLDEKSFQVLLFFNVRLWLMLSSDNEDAHWRRVAQLQLRSNEERQFIRRAIVHELIYFLLGDFFKKNIMDAHYPNALLGIIRCLSQNEHEFTTIFNSIPALFRNSFHQAWNLLEQPLTFCSAKHFDMVLDIKGQQRKCSLLNKSADGCQPCEDAERNGLISERMKNNLHSNILLKDDIFNASLRRLIVKSSNQCSLTCPYCAKHASSTWAHLLGESSVTKYHWNMDTRVVGTLTSPSCDLREIVFDGCETIYQDDHLPLLELIARHQKSQNIHLRYILNRFEPEPWLLEKWQQFNMISIMLKMDGVGDSYEEFHYPLKWSNFENSVRAMDGTAPNIYCYLYVTFNLFNMVNLNEMLTWLDQRSDDFIKINPEILVDFCYNWAAVYNLPESTKGSIRQYCENNRFGDKYKNVFSAIKEQLACSGTDMSVSSQKFLIELKKKRKQIGLDENNFSGEGCLK